jgi:phage replication-related protein YjqB (UPF0714/DUF867 family)
LLADLHREDIKASIRKKYGSVRAFERHHGLPNKAVNRIFAGGTSARVVAAINDHLQAEGFERIGRNDNPKRRASHQNREKAA